MDWPGLMRLALGRMGLSPGVFWSLTPVEFFTMLGVEAGPFPLTRDELERLERAFPDASGPWRGTDDGGTHGS